MDLVKPLASKQVDTACKLYDHLPGWQVTDRALEQLADKFPGFDFESCLLKTVTINSLYATMVFATWRMAEHVHEVLGQKGLLAVGPELVETIAALPDKGGNEVKRRFRSFASKFAHFFIDSERFPILDSYAEKTIAYHLGGKREKNHAETYIAYVHNFSTLKRSVGLLEHPNRELDRYLWLAGQYRAFLRNPGTRLNAEVRGLFESTDQEYKGLLEKLIDP